MFGWFGREKVNAERTPPAEGFEPTKHLGWQAAFAIIDPTEHTDGQKLSVEDNKADIGTPRAIVRSFETQFNRSPETPFFIHIQPLISQGSFWDFSNAHRNSIESIGFDVPVPNMFGGKNDFVEELRSLRDNENVATVNTKLKSDKELTVSSGRLKQIVDYVEQGGGELTATATDGASYNSVSHEKRITVNFESHARDPAKFLRNIRSFLDRIF
jgi:hypothetical protein